MGSVVSDLPSMKLLYVADPMCSWCFAFAPLLDSVRRELKSEVSVRYVLGGLAPDDDQPMSAETKAYIQDAWRSIEERTQARFNWEYWTRCEPRRSTWPACRAVLAAGEKGEAMFAAIQQAYYAGARDPSDPEVLLELGEELGFERHVFKSQLADTKTEAALLAEFKLRDQLGASAFPSVGVQRGEQFQLLTSGWVDAPGLRSALAGAGLLNE
jgi:putative protein-disulfide isomerase